MEIIKELRKRHNYTQAELARMLNVSQQAVARWESGKTKPSLLNMRDLAVIFGTSVDGLLGADSESESIITNHYNHWRDEGMTGFWGHLGLGLPRNDKTKWYPITLEAANYIANALESDLGSFLSVETLNNRSLYINKERIHHVYLLDDNADYIKGDWALDWDSYQGFPSDIYPAILEYAINGSLSTQEYSDNFIEMIEAIVNKFDIDDDKAFDYIERSYIWTVNRTFKHTISFDGLADLGLLEGDMLGPYINLGDYDRGFSLHLPLKDIVLVDVPSHQIKEVEDQIWEETEGVIVGEVD